MDHDGADAASPRQSQAVVRKTGYSPPWADTSIIGIAGSSGSGKTSLALAIVESLNLPWVVVLSMDSFYKPLTPAESIKAFLSEFDFDAPAAIDFDTLVEVLGHLKSGKKADIPVYSFEKHARLEQSNTVYSPHVLVLEGIFALHDRRVLDMLDLKIFAEADADLCLSRRILRDVKHRGRDIDGCIKQWFTYVKPNFHKYVEPQRNVADIIVPRSIENTVAISMVSDRILKILEHKSLKHQLELSRLGQAAHQTALERNVVILKEDPQILGINALLLDPETDREDFIFYFDRISTMLIERAVSFATVHPHQITTPDHNTYLGVHTTEITSAVTILRGGSCLETGLRRTLPDCQTGRVLIQTVKNEPLLHYLKLPPDIASHGLVLLIDSQVSSGGAALMAVRVLVDHGVSEERILLVAWEAGIGGVKRLIGVFSGVRVVVAKAPVEEGEEGRWVERRYLGC